MRNKHFLLVLVVISLILVFVWFRKGELIAGGEEGLWLFNPLRTFQLDSYGWTELGVGVSLPSFLPRTPLLFFDVLLTKFLPSWLTQAVLFFLIITSGLVGMFLLSKEFVGDKKEFAPLVISLFYLFNIYSETQIWNRFIYSGFLSWSYLPIALLLAIRWLKTRRVLYLFLFLISSFVYSAAFVTISFVFVIWIPIGLFTLYFLWEERKSFRELAMAGFQAFVLGAGWLIANVWWIYPYFKTSSGNVQQFFQISDTNMDILKGVSQFGKTGDVALLRQTYYFTGWDLRDSFWHDFYQNPISYLLGFFGLFLVITGIIFLFRKKYKYRNYILILFVLGWFLVKGSNPPLGYEFYKLLFSGLKFTMMFRNPYEKLGLIFLLSYSVMFGLGTYYVSKRFGRWKPLFVVSVLLLVCGILVWPMWTGDVYTDRVKLTIPQYYSQANKIIDSDPKDVRILFLPLIKGDVGFYKWKYMGGVPTEFLFDKPVINRPISSVYPYFQRLLDSFSRKDKKALGQLLKDLNVGYVIVAYDLEEGRNDVQNTKQLEEFLSSDSDVQFVMKIGELSIYKVGVQEMGGQILVSEKGGPSISYKRISPVKYEVSVVGAGKPYDLIFKSTFDSNWEARIDGEKIVNHTLVYDYANRWVVNKKGSYNIEIIFKIWPWD